MSWSIPSKEEAEEYTRAYLAAQEAYAEEHIDDCCEMIDDAPTVGGWISVKDRLPEEDKEVLAYNGAYMFIAAYTTNPTKYWYTISGSAMRTVTHWMPLPEPPKEGV